MAHKAIYFALIILYVPAEPAPRSGCTISINNDLTAPQVLVLRPEGGYGNDAFYLPDNGDVITLSENQLVDLACPGGRVSLSGVATDYQVAQAICTNGRFSILGHELPFSEFTCTVIPTRSIRATGNTCLGKYQEIETGFILGDKFMRHLLICFDQSAQNVLFSEFNLTKTISGSQTGFPRPSWLQGSGFFNVSGTTVDTLYTRNRQRETINALLGLSPSSDQYIAQTGNLFLARGHLAAKADFVYGSQQRLTFYFVNAAPQWQQTNAQNWFFMERSIRDFSVKNRLDLIVYTGTFGATSLPHAVSGEDIELYLYVNGQNRGIPVPRLLWKLVYDPVTKAGVVFVSVNNPYVVNHSKDVICTDICERYDWLTWRPQNISSGYSYCCSVEEFKQTVTTLPDIEVLQLL